MPIRLCQVCPTQDVFFLRSYENWSTIIFAFPQSRFLEIIDQPPSHIIPFWTRNMLVLPAFGSWLSIFTTHILLQRNVPIPPKRSPLRIHMTSQGGGVAQRETDSKTPKFFLRKKPGGDKKAFPSSPPAYFWKKCFVRRLSLHFSKFSSQKIPELIV